MISERLADNTYIYDCLKGKKLFGNDFNEEEILEWHEIEEQAYANLGNKSKDDYTYGYNEINKYYGYSFLTNAKFENTLAIGAAYGHELLPIIHKLKNITILEPGIIFRNHCLKREGLDVTFRAPSPAGNLPFDDNTFDLITCFGVLHHIPNVEYVITEIHRIMKPNSYALIREPVVSMGDWRKPRPGLTMLERGIPYKLFNNFVESGEFLIISSKPCLYSPLLRLFRFLKEPYNNNFFVRLDNFFSYFMSRKAKYHPETVFDKFQYNSIFYVLKKGNN